MKKFISNLLKFYKRHKLVIFLISLALLLVLFFKFIEMMLSFLNFYSDGITALSALLAAIFGISGVNIWKLKMKGKLDYDIARQYLKAILRLRDAIKIVRNPFIPVVEMQNALKEQEFNSEYYKDNEKVNRAVYSARWNKVQEAWTNLETILLEAEISWGVEAVKVQKKLDNLVRKLRSVIWLFINYPESYHKKGEENDKLLYDTHDINDGFSLEIEKEINEIKIFLERYL